MDGKGEGEGGREGERGREDGEGEGEGGRKGERGREEGERMEREREGERGREDGEGEGGREGERGWREDGGRMERKKGRREGEGEGGREGERERGWRGRGRGRGREKKGRREEGRKGDQKQTIGVMERHRLRMRSLTSAFHKCAGDPPRTKTALGVSVWLLTHSPSTCLSDISALTIEQFSISPPPADPEWLKIKQQAKFREELPL